MVYNKFVPKYNVIVPTDVNPKPESFEISAAAIVAEHFKSDAKFIKRTQTKTADITVGNIMWEIKSPTGRGKRNIQHQFYRALKQSPNIIFDARRSKIHITKIRRELEKQYQMSKSIKRLVLITKEKKVVVFSR